MPDAEAELSEADVKQPFVTVTGRHRLPVCEAQLVAMIDVVAKQDVAVTVGQFEDVQSLDFVTMIVVGTVTGGSVCVILRQGVEIGQKLGQMRDLDVVSVLLQHPTVVVKFP